MLDVLEYPSSSREQREAAAPPPPAIGKKDGTTSPINPAPWQEESEKGSPNPNNGDPACGRLEAWQKNATGKNIPPPLPPVVV